MMRQLKNIALILTLLMLAGFTLANAEVSFNVGLGSGNYYQPVGDYDYLPYAYQSNPGYAAPRINFRDMMSQYGVWVSVSPFGQVWKPYASNDWRPYTQGHWISTQQHGQMWEGYEPWAWAGYHYGDWVYARNQGWVWIPGYEWHPGRVTHARSYDSMGWMPTPPSGYDYSRGYLSHVGPNNQFAYNDNDFGMEFGAGNFGYGGPYYDQRYRNMYYNPSYNKINFNLWVFINNSHYGYDNYAGYMLGSDYTRHVFDRRLVRITNRRIERSVLERIIRQRIRVTAVETREFQTDRQRIRVVVPAGTDSVARIRKNSREVVRNIIAPGFAEKRKAFKGQNSRNKDVVSKIFQQEKLTPKIENLSSEQIINQARSASQKRKQSRKKIQLAEKEKLVRFEKEGKFKEPKTEKQAGKKVSKSEVPESRGKLQKIDKAPAKKQQQQQPGIKKQNDNRGQKPQNIEKRNEPVKEKQQELQKRNDDGKRDLDSPQKKVQKSDAVQQKRADSTDDKEVKSDKKVQKKSKSKKAKEKANKEDKD